jgi:hypothetical protein
VSDWNGEIENATQNDRREVRLIAMCNYLRENPDILMMVALIKEALSKSLDWDAMGLWEQLSDQERITLWIAPKYGGLFTTDERKRLKPTSGEHNERIRRD